MADGLERVALEPVPPLEDERVTSPRGRARSGPGAAVAPTRDRRVRRRGLRRSAARARRARIRELVVLDADLASDCRVRGVRASEPGPIRRGRDRRAGHGLDGRRAGAPGPPAGRQLVRELPRLARERADLQPGERAHEGRLRAALRGPDPRRAGQVAPEPARHLAARGAAERRRRPPGNAEETRARRRAGRCWRRTRASPIRLAIGPSPRRIELPDEYRLEPGAAPCCARARTRCCSRTGR